MPQLVIYKAGAESDQHVFEVVRDLEVEETEAYKISQQQLRGFLSDLQRIDMVRNSHAEYRALLSRYREEYVSGPPWNDVIAAGMRHESNRRLRAFFTEFRTFLEHAEIDLKREYGKDSDEVLEFRKACSKEYDASFAYRFVSALRNYGQHVQPPLQNVSLKAVGLDDRTEDAIYELAFRVDRDTLLQSSYDWKPVVRREVEDLPDKFSLEAYIEDAMERLERINVAMIAIKTPRARSASRVVLRLAEPLRGQGRSLMVADFPIDQNRRQKALDFKYDEIPVEIAETVMRFPEPQELRRWPRLDVSFSFCHRAEGEKVDEKRTSGTWEEMFSQHLREKQAGPLICPVCKEQDTFEPKGTIGGSMADDVTRPEYQFGYAACSNCGYSIFFDAKITGLWFEHLGEG